MSGISSLNIFYYSLSDIGIICSTPQGQWLDCMCMINLVNRLIHCCESSEPAGKEGRNFSYAFVYFLFRTHFASSYS